MNETTLLKQIRLEAARRGVILWRNNRGAYCDNTGRWVRYGLANDSKQLNNRIKSADLIGITPVKITSEIIGHTLGVFTSLEIKREGQAALIQQINWGNLITRHGGYADIISSVKEFVDQDYFLR